MHCSVRVATQDCDGARPPGSAHSCQSCRWSSQAANFFLPAGPRCRTAPDLLCVTCGQGFFCPYDKVQAHLAPSTPSTITVFGVCMQYIHPPSKSFPFDPCHYSQYPPTGIFAQLTCSSSLQFFFGLLTANPLRLGQTRLALGLPCDTGSSIAAALWTIDNCHGAPTVNPA